MDGLVNDEIYGYTISNSLPQYLQKRGLTNIVDDQVMITNPVFKMRGGYSEKNFSKCVDRVQELSHFSPAENAGDQVDLFRLDTHCLLGVKTPKNMLGEKRIYFRDTKRE